MSQESPRRTPSSSLTWEAAIAPHEVRLTVRDGSQGVHLIVTGDQLAVRGILERPRLDGNVREPSTVMQPVTEGARDVPRVLRPASRSGAAF